jgi:hypothetical protein
MSKVIESPIPPVNESVPLQPESGLSESDVQKLNRLANESASRATSQIKRDENSVPGDTIISNI